ncbi:hypothetical protein MJ561_02240 [Klebsiella pneumoniae]|nr:hypothetical protein MJ561_02240 [Klebsiella pneumoniae]
MNQEDDWESTSPAFREANIQVKPDRLQPAPRCGRVCFIKGRDVHMIDFYYWDISARVQVWKTLTLASVSSLPLPVTQKAAALILSPAMTPKNMLRKLPTTSLISVWRVWKPTRAALELGVDYGRANPQDDYRSKIMRRKTAGCGSVNIIQSIWGGFNKFRFSTPLTQ